MVLMILHAGLQKRHRHKGQTFGLSGRGEGGMIEENSTETYTLPYVKQMTSASPLMWASQVTQWQTICLPVLKTQETQIGYLS